MKMNAREVQRLMQYLRNVAEVDSNDIIANCASQLAYELETVKLPFDFNSMNEKRQAVVRYAISKRDEYVLLPGKKHAQKVAI
jgi:hypothetical protein